MMLKFTSFLYVTCVLYEVSCSNTIESTDKTKRFFMDWMASAAKFFASPMTIPMSMAFKAECVNCKCNTECNGERFAKTFFGVKPDDRKVCGEDYWDSIYCGSGQRQTSSPIQPTVSYVGVTPDNIPKGPGCDKLCAITAVARSLSQTSPTARICTKGILNTNEALPMACCKLNTPNTWQKGTKIMPDCQNIPHYTPVAAFINNTYITGSAGIMSGCLTDGQTGFQMMYQDCEHKPGILHLSKQNKQNNDPDLFYTIH